MSCFRCDGMLVMDPIVMRSIHNLLIDIYTHEDSDIYLGHPPNDEMLDRINRHIILMDSLPYDRTESGE